MSPDIANVHWEERKKAKLLQHNQIWITDKEVKNKIRINIYLGIPGPYTIRTNENK